MTTRRVLFDQDRLDAYNLAREFVRSGEALLKLVSRAGQQPNRPPSWTASWIEAH
jgi:hypothetical protein